MNVWIDAQLSPLLAERLRRTFAVDATCVRDLEIGHVTARHSVSQMSKQQLAQLGFAAGMMLSPEFAQYGNLAQVGLGLMFMKFSRSDESQSDSLGLKYMMAGGYDPRELVDVFTMLDGLSQQSGDGRLPQWMSTHPDPENRRLWATKADFPP